MATTRWRSVIFVDLDGTLIRGPFESTVFPAMFAELSLKTGLQVPEVRRRVLAEYFARHDDPDVPAVLVMDWDDIVGTVARELGVELEANALEMVRAHPGPPHAVILDQADRVLRRLASPQRAIVLATKGLSKYQRPVLDALGLTPLFTGILTTDAHRALKKDLAFYGPWPGRAPLQVMVGDLYADDVLAAHGFGFRTVWKLSAGGRALQALDPLARPLAYPYAGDQPVRPDAIILSLGELPGVVERLEAEGG